MKWSSLPCPPFSSGYWRLHVLHLPFRGWSKHLSGPLHLTRPGVTGTRVLVWRAQGRGDIWASVSLAWPPWCWSSFPFIVISRLVVINILVPVIMMMDFYCVYFPFYCVYLLCKFSIILYTLHGSPFLPNPIFPPVLILLLLKSFRSHLLGACRWISFGLCLKMSSLPPLNNNLIQCSFIRNLVSA